MFYIAILFKLALAGQLFKKNSPLAFWTVSPVVSRVALQEYGSSHLGRVRESWTPNDDHILILGICDYVTSHDK